MNILGQPVKELTEVRTEIKRLKVREKTLCEGIWRLRRQPDFNNDDQQAERQLRQVFKQNRFADKVGLTSA